jgi:hypothetical protein
MYQTLKKHFLLRIRIVTNPPTSHICTIHTMKVARRPPMRVHDVAGESAVYYPHNKGPKFIAHRLHEENSRAPPISPGDTVPLKSRLRVRAFECGQF